MEKPHQEAGNAWKLCGAELSKMTELYKAKAVAPAGSSSTARFHLTRVGSVTALVRDELVDILR